ncbi:SAM-dependent methyltransferase [Amycolatopsis sp. cg9]|uniref:SAM-dependent methyltransferase n=1 Tax=Amycolatopsis sp. cg9 TaxID=3238801 RepID=UPI0035251F07
MTHTRLHPAAPVTRGGQDVPRWRIPAGADPTRVNLAYLYDAFREARSNDHGDDRTIPAGKDAHENERDAVRHLSASAPHAGFVFRSEQAFLDRVTTYLVKHQEVGTVIVAGAGLPHLDPRNDLHRHIRSCEAGNRKPRRASVVYVERDPLVVAAVRTIADDDAGVHVVAADPWDPAAMWNSLHAHSGRSGILARDHQPVALLLAGVMSFHGGTRTEVAEVVQDHLAQLPAGSFLAMTHLFLPEHPDMAAAARAFEQALREFGPGTGSLATRAEIEAMLAGTRLLPHGIVPAFGWYPDGPPDPPVCGHFNAAALAQKPLPDADLPAPPWHPGKPP